MSVHDEPPAGKLSRLGLYIPFGLLAVAIVAWSVCWLWARGEAERRLDLGVSGLAKAGYQIAWKDRKISGYPFRLDVTLTDVSAREPSGWGLEAPTLEGEAFMHAPTHWVIAAPQSLTFIRPVGGPVSVTGKLIRASLNNFGKRPPNLSFEAVDAVFQPQPGAQPFAFTGAQRVEFHLRAGPDDEGGVFLKLDGGKPRPGSALALIAGDKPVAIVWNSTLSKMSAFAGADWPDAVRRWTAAGGRWTVRQAGITAGDARLGVNRGTLSAGPDGRLTGDLDVTLSQAPRALAALAQTGMISAEAAEAASAVAIARQGAGAQLGASLTFQAGRTTLGPVAIAPAPKVYEVR